MMSPAMHPDPDDWPHTESLRVKPETALAKGVVFAERYRIESQIGRGGFGAVYRAIELSLERPVALKILRRDRRQGDDLMRFRREAELARRLMHPHTVRLYDFGECESGEYIVYELLEGRSLAAEVAAVGAFDPARAARIGTGIAKSLMEAHALGIVHRDIKPANVFLCNFAGEPDFPKVLDFGIARDVQSAATQLTAQGEVIGTPSYMAPEHLRGEPPAASMDVYALGITLAELIEGRAAYRGTAMDVSRAVLSAEPVPLSERVLGSVFGDVIRRAVEKDPRLRQASAAELREELERRLDSLRPSATASFSLPSAPPAVTPERPRSRLPWVLLLLGALIIVIGGGALTLVAFSMGDADFLRSDPAWVDGDSVPNRMRERGWSAVNVEKTDKQVKVTGVRGDRNATVLRMNGKSEAAAELLSGLYQKQGYAMARSGKALLAVRIQGSSGGNAAAEESQALIAELE